MSNSSSTFLNDADFGQWDPGQVLPGGYRILRKLGQGGMGTVHLVERQTYRGKILQFAIKIIRSNAVNIGRRQNAFIRELRNWIDLPDHPNLTQCKFFHSIYDRITIFAEYVAGGSLSQFVRAGKVKDPKLIWDIAIQSARGLAAAHACGMLHLDVKPSNMLLSQDSQLKLTDFGLSVGLPDRVVDKSRSGTKSSSQGMTPAFASPEQMHEQSLDHATDQWSWAVTILYTLTGSVSWQYGIFAGRRFNEIVKEDDTFISEPMKKILHRCFQEKPDQRWESMNDLSKVLETGYRESFGQEYFRETPSYIIPPKSQAIEQDTPETIMEIETDKLLEKACKVAEKDLAEQHRIIPKRKGSGRAKLLVNLERLNRAERFFKEGIETDPEICHINILKTFILKAEVLKESDDRVGSLKQLDQAMDRYSTFSNNMEKASWLDIGVSIFTKKAALFIAERKFDVALEVYGKALEMAVRLTEIRSPKETTYNICWIRMNVAVALGRLQRLEDSINEATEVIAILEKSEDVMDEPSRLKLLAGSYTNKAASLGFMDQDRQAADYFLKAVETVENLINNHNKSELIHRLIQTNLNASKALLYCNELDKSEQLALQTLKLIKEKLTENSRIAIINRVAASEIVIHIMKVKGQTDHAIGKIDRLIEAVEYYVYQRGKSEHYKDLVHLLEGKSVLLEDIGDIDGRDKTLKLMEKVKDEADHVFHE
ncbi:serine/threonine protein kinase [bacterium]|nr:serine/threonine protein kinase [bacterium]